MKKVLLLPLVGALMLVLAPAAQAATVADVDLIDATINKASVVRVVGEVTCPAGRDHQEPGVDRPVRRGGRAGRPAVSRPSLQGAGELQRQPRPVHGSIPTSTTDEEFAAGELTEVSLSFTACSVKPDSVCGTRPTSRRSSF